MCPVPRAHEYILNNYSEIIFQQRVLKTFNIPEWVIPHFYPTKNGSVRFLYDFREINQRTHRKSFSTPKIKNMLLNLGRFTYVS